MKRQLAILTLALASVGAFVAPPSHVSAAQTGTANGAVAVVAQVENVLNNASVLNGSQVGLVNLNNSLNNLTALNNVLNNSPILNNFLNNSPILSGNTITIQNIDVAIANGSLNGININVLNYLLQNANTIIGVAVLSGNQVLAFVPAA
jgi:hypothetical protein